MWWLFISAGADSCSWSKKKLFVKWQIIGIWIGESKISDECPMWKYIDWAKGTIDNRLIRDMKHLKSTEIDYLHVHHTIDKPFRRFLTQIERLSVQSVDLFLTRVCAVLFLSLSVLLVRCMCDSVYVLTHSNHSEASGCCSVAKSLALFIFAVVVLVPSHSPCCNYTFCRTYSACGKDTQT